MFPLVRLITSILFVTALWLVPNVLPIPHALASCATAGCAAPVTCNVSAGSCWRPALNSRWQYQLQGSPNKSGGCLYASTGFINTTITGASFVTGTQVAPAVFDIDFYQDGKCYAPQNYGVLNTAALNALHANGAKVIAYVDAGTAEHWRPDFPQYDSFNTSCAGCLFGSFLSHYHDENYLNINATATGINPNTGVTETTRQFILDEISSRLDTVKHMGFDGVEFDNVDEYTNKSGLTITADTQLLFNTALANLAHSKGLSVGLKNDNDQLADLKPYFDYAVDEQCFQYNQCNFPAPGLPDWIASGKAVFDVEYQLNTSKFCAQANSWNFNAVLKDANLYDTPYTPCR